MTKRFAMNKWVHVGNDGVRTGLVAADSLQDAQDDAQSMGLVGSVISMDQHVNSPEYAQQLLNDKRRFKMHQVKAMTGQVAPHLLFISDSSLDSAGLALKAVAQYAVQKITDIQTMTDQQLDQYDPLTDPQLQV